MKMMGQRRLSGDFIYCGFSFFGCSQTSPRMLARNPLCVVVVNTDSHCSVGADVGDEAEPQFPIPKHKRVTFDTSGKDFLHGAR